ncbi:MAG TPA: NAD-dependent epimerase/dehydratase family protein [Solirubrobacterales bacterium]|nr:NAD-dependent epimerase/dehydratase family protein [Solirubrobacterales bacterium]
MKRSLVTGGHGFVASHLVRELLDRGDSVAAVDAANPVISGLDLQGARQEVELLQGDLADPRVAETLIGTGEFDTIFHLAAQTLVGEATRDAARTFESNVRGTWNVLEASRRAEVPAVVVASSDKAYGPQSRLPYREDAPLLPHAPYEASKAAADLIARSYWPSFGLPVAVTRLANVYGGGDLNFSRLIPEAVTAWLEGRRPAIRSDGTPERDYLYVDDAAEAYLALEHAVGAGGPAAGEAFNAGNDQPHSVSEVLEITRELVGTDLRPDLVGLGTPRGEIDRQYVDSTRLRELTGWRPQVELREGLARTVEWYRENPEVRPAVG